MRVQSLFVLLIAGATATAQPPAFHVVDYDLALTLPDAGKQITGVATLTVRRIRAADTLVLDLRDMRADRVLLNGQPAAFTQDAAHVRIFVGSGPGDTLRVAVTYQGVPADGLIIGTDSAGRWIGFGDNWPNRARHWIPSIDHPSDKATVTWSVNAPSDRRVVANGKLLDETPLPVAPDPDGSAGRPLPRTLTRWRESRPIPVYLMTIAAAPLERYDLGPTACGLADDGGCVAQQVYSAPEQRNVLPGEFARAGDMVEFIARLVGPFPYEKLAHLQTSTRYGGMENASAIFYADGPFRGRGTSRGTIAHETAHQWFGDAVTEREWAHVWLSEGFATYFEELWTRHAFGDSAFRAELTQTRAEILGAAEVAARPVIDSLQTDLMALLNTNSYQKGGWTLHMLRTLVGDSAFYQGIRDYWTAHKHGTALTDDLMAAVEQRAGTRLGWFFDQWLRRPGFASLSTHWRYDATARRVLLDIEQDGRFGFYRFPLAIDITDASGRVQRLRVDVPAVKSASVTLPTDLAAAPRALSFDPDVELLADIRTRRVAPGTSDVAPGTADAALSRGRLDEAEAFLYEATRKAPRDPVARAALGSFLAARGHLKAGAVLLEEARLFGGDPVAIDERLGHVYQWLGTWEVPDGRASATPFWTRAAFLVKHPTVCSGRDSTAVRLEPNEIAGLGRIALEIGGTSQPADIDARVEGLVLPASSSAASGAERFGIQDGSSLTAVYALSIGTMSCRNVPARFEAVSVARVGLDVLAPMAPTFDAARRTLVLRAAPTPTSAVGAAMPLLLTFPGVKIAPRTGQPAVSIESAAGRAALRGTVWTFDLRRGSIFVNR